MTPGPAVGQGAVRGTVQGRESAVLSWVSENADTCVIEPGIGSVEPAGTVTVSPTATTTYTITATGPGGTATATATVTVIWPEPAVSLKAEPDTIGYRDTSTLSWSASYADACTMEPNIGSVPISGTMAVSPPETTSYTITVSGPGGTAISSAVVTVVITEPEVTFRADPEAVAVGATSTLTWSAAHADTCEIEPDVGSVAVSGSQAVNPVETRTYTLTATGPGGTVAAAATVLVVPAGIGSIEITHPEDGTEIDADTIRVAGSVDMAGASVVVNGVAATVEGGVFIADGVQLQPGANRLIATAYVPDGAETTAQDAIRVVRQYTYAPQPESAFGAQYEDLVPPDAQVAVYDQKRFSLVTGTVLDVDGASLQGVAVTVLDHPEYGIATTGADGRFSLPLEGGATAVTLQYRKDAYIPVQRTVNVPPNDIIAVKTVRMIPLDAAATDVRFDGDSSVVATHRGSAVTDARGTRAAAVTFTGDNSARVVDAQGNVIETLSEITTRATTYPEPDAMPAELPPASEYTYCVELSVDGAENVRFDKPVITWVENFLGFEVGLPVPVGYYDTFRGVWVPAENGVVVRLLDTDGDGTVDALDANGDGAADDLDGDGAVSDEADGLGDSAVYPPDATFWRVPVSHFTSWDFNFPAILSEDAEEPDPPGSPRPDEENERRRREKNCFNSYVDSVTRVFHEDIPIPGTGIDLHYASSRVAGYHTRITVPASGETVPDSLKQIVVKLDIAGKSYEQVLDPLPGQVAEFAWDGRDHLDRTAYGVAAAHVSIGFVYDLFYAVPADAARAFGLPGGVATDVPAQQERILWATYRLPVTRGRGTVATGWTLSPHHEVHLTDPTPLHKGDGTIETVANLVMERAAGNGDGTLSGDGGPANEAGVPTPGGLTVDGAGNLYITSSHSVLKVDPGGTIRRIAGAGEWSCWLTNNRPATLSGLYGAGSVAVDKNGNLYIADPGHHCIRKVDENGIITTIAGVGLSCSSGEKGYGGDAGPAVDALLDSPTGIALDADGNLYIADYYNHRIRRVGTDGIIVTVAGNGTEGFSGNGGPAVEAQLSLPRDVAVDARGNLYILDHGNIRIRRVDPSGTITTVAGTGAEGYTGDGGPATQATLSNELGSIALDAEGSLYIADTNNDCIRKVLPDGTIVTVVGTGELGASADGASPTQAMLYRPGGVTVDGSGNLYVSDTWNHCVRKVLPVGAYRDLAAGGEFPFAEADGTGHITNAAGRHQSTVDLATGTVLREFEYDVENRLTGITDIFGNRITIDRDGSGVPTAIISPDGLRTTLSVDTNNHLTGITYPDGNSYTFEYTADGLMTAETEPEGNRFDHAFDAAGRITDLQDEEGGHIGYSRVAHENGDILTEVLTAEGLLTQHLEQEETAGTYTATTTGPNGDLSELSETGDELSRTETLACGTERVTEYALDPEYQFRTVASVTETTPAGLQRVTRRDRTYEDTDADGVPDRTTDSVAVNGNTTTLVNDALQGTKTVTSPEGRTVTAAYDPATLLVQNRSLPGLYDTEYSYDDRGRMTGIRKENRETTYTYDADGFMASMTDPENRTTTYTRDPVGRITGISRPDGGTVGFAYDANGNMTVLTNPMDVNHGFGFNRVNLNTDYTTPLSGSYAYIYDKDRRLVETRFPSGSSITNLYDKSRLVRTVTPETTIDMTYLCGDKPETLSMDGESVTYGYDGSLVISETLSGTLNQALAYTYDSDFNVTAFTYAGETVSYAYDNDGLLTGAGDYVITRNAGNGLPESVTAGAFNLNRTFNGYGEIELESVTVSGQAAVSWSVVRSPVGRITGKTETVAGVIADYAYSYDAMGRLRTVTKDGSLVEEYDYDQNGTRIYEMNTHRGIAGRNYTYDDEDHLLTAGDTTYAYDPDGFLTTRTKGTEVTTYDYSSRGELLTVYLPDGRTIEYVHDPLGRRIAKKIDGVMAEKYLWQGMTRILAVYDGSDNLLVRFNYADSRMPVSMTKEGVSYYLAYDQVGSLRIVADASGNMLKRIDYDAFGNIISDSNPTFTVPFGFAGGLHDQDTDLIRFGYRDYDPDIGRWTAKDPIFFEGGDIDLYGYCLNDPVNIVDQLGREVLGLSCNWPDYVPYQFTQGQKSALIKIAAGSGLIAVGALTYPSPSSYKFIGSGATLAFVGLTMYGVETFFGADTSKIPSDASVYIKTIKEIMKQYDRKHRTKKRCTRSEKKDRCK